MVLEGASREIGSYPCEVHFSSSLITGYCMSMEKGVLDTFVTHTDYRKSRMALQCIPPKCNFVFVWEHMSAPTYTFSLASTDVELNVCMHLSL